MEVPRFAPKTLKPFDKVLVRDENTRCWICGLYSHKKEDKQCRFWTIQDAKDGDVLAAHECYVVFKEIDGLNIKCYCTYHYLGLNPSFYKDTLQNKDAFLPATKEQRDAMMKAMADAGYEWDAEKKELKYKLTAFEDAIKDMMDNYRDAIDEDEATAEEVKNVLTIFNTL